MPLVYARVIQPRKPFPPDRKAVEKILREAAREVLEVAIEYHKRIVADWKNQPDFKGKVVVNLDKRIEWYVWPTGEHKKIWQLLTDGTPKRDITPKKPGGVLVFMSDYQPRTGPGGRHKGPGKAVGPKVFTAKVKDHEIKARKFEETIFTWMKKRKDVSRIMKNAMARSKRVLSPRA